MVEIYNDQVIEVTTDIKSDMSTIQDIITNVRKNRKADGTSKIKAADLAADFAIVRELATKHGYGPLTDWKGNDKPVPVDVPVK